MRTHGTCRHWLHRSSSWSALWSFTQNCFESCAPRFSTCFCRGHRRSGSQPHQQLATRPAQTSAAKPELLRVCGQAGAGRAFFSMPATSSPTATGQLQGRRAEQGLCHSAPSLSASEALCQPVSGAVHVIEAELQAVACIPPFLSLGINPCVRRPCTRWPSSQAWSRKTLLGAF